MDIRLLAEALQSSAANGAGTPTLKGAVIEAVTLAKKAVTADGNGQLLLAMQLYRDCADRLQGLCSYMTEEKYRDVLTQFCEAYRNRAASLQLSAQRQNQSNNSDKPSAPSSPSSSRSIPSPSVASASQPTPSSSSSSSSNSQPVLIPPNGLPSFPIQFQEKHLKCDAPIPPSEPILRPFWLMQRLQTSMLQGAHISASLYIPKEVWFMSGVKIFACNEKIGYCEGLQEALRNLSTAAAVGSHSPEVISRELDKFIVKSEALQMTLSKVLPQFEIKSSSAVPSSSSSSSSSSSAAAGSSDKDQSSSSSASSFGARLTKFGTNLVRKVVTVSKGANDTPYVPWLLSIFEQAYFLQEWIKKYASNPSFSSPKLNINGKLERSVSFLNVCCIFAMQDLYNLLEFYTQRSRESLSRLVPHS